MKIDIIRNRIKDSKILDIILKTLEYFCYHHHTQEQSLVQSKNKEGIHNLLFELINYVEPGLIKKFSENFSVIISESSNFAIKFDTKYFLGLKYDKFDIIIFKTPYICIPSLYTKPELKSEEIENCNKSINELKEAGYIKCFKLINFQSKDLQINEDFIFEKILYTTALYSIKYSEDKDFSNFCQLLQYEISKQQNNYHWCVVVSKKFIASQHFIDTSNVFFQAKFLNPDKKFIISNKLHDFDIVIYKKTAVFESVFKNILTLRLYEVELKHLVIFLSLICFIVLMASCRQEYKIDQNLTWYEENICLNKRSILGGLGLMFIFAIIFGVVRDKISKKKNQKKIKLD